MPLRSGEALQPISDDRRDGVQGSAQCLGQQLDPVQVTHGGEHMRTVGALSAPRPQKPSFTRSVQHAGKQAPAGLVLQQAGAELA